MATAKRKTTKRATKAMSRKRRGTGKRELVKNQAGNFFARRTGRRSVQGDGRARSLAVSGSAPEGEDHRKARARRSRRPQTLAAERQGGPMDFIGLARGRTRHRRAREVGDAGRRSRRHLRHDRDRDRRRDGRAAGIRAARSVSMRRDSRRDGWSRFSAPCCCCSCTARCSPDLAARGSKSARTCRGPTDWMPCSVFPGQPTQRIVPPLLPPTLQPRKRPASAGGEVVELPNDSNGRCAGIEPATPGL
jgi:hypothetical protein